PPRRAEYLRGWRRGGRVAQWRSPGGHDQLHGLRRGGRGHPRPGGGHKEACPPELGGKSAMIVRADADIQAAGGAAAFNFTMHAGQGCALLTRYIVHNSVRAQFVETVKATLGFLKVGNPAEPDTIVGPLISEAARAKTENFVKTGLAEGGKLVAGGKRPEHLQKGYFFEPTLFDDVDNRSTLAQCE